MERETITLSKFEIAPILDELAFEDNIYDDFYDEDGEVIGDPIWNQFSIIEVNTDYFDLEDGYENKITIVKRKSDDKFFKGCWMYSLHVGNIYDIILTEVFPKQITKTVYE
jgi:hypothetical protein